MAKYDVTFDYFHGYESEQFAFTVSLKCCLRMIIFVTCPVMQVLYGLMLDQDGIVYEKQMD